MAKIQSRKEEHVRICLGEDVQYAKDAGFSDVEFLHNCVPELDMGRVDIGVSFFGRKMNAPFIIDGMTGGYAKAKEINKRLAAAAQEHSVPFGLGSQRAMVENPILTQTYSVRDVAPDVFIIGNIGAAQIAHYPLAKIKGALEAVDANALAVHLNALQEALQPEGNRNFEGVLCAISKLSDALKIPIIAKETGAGISADAAVRLRNAGVRMLNVSGAGGTSWSKVEYLRGKPVEGFEEWGIPTVVSIVSCCHHLPVIASGGVRSGLDAAKAIALGAKMAAGAQPFLAAKNPSEEMEKWKMQLRTAMFLTGSANLEKLGKSRIFITGRTKQLLESLRVDVSEYAMR